MRTGFIALAALMLATKAASGAALLYEPFNYTAGLTLDGQTSPDDGVWSVASNNTTPPPINIVAGSLTSPTGLPGAIGNMIQWGAPGTATNGAVDRVQVVQQTAGTVYWSMLFRADDITGTVTGTTGAFVAGFNNKPGSQTSGVITVAGARLVIRKDSADATKYNFGTSVNSNNGGGTTPIQQFETVQRATGETHYLVGSYTFNPSTNDDVAQLWIDPDPSTFDTNTIPAPNLTSTGADLNGSPSGIGTFFFRANTSAPKQMSADELRVATSWAEVTSTADSTSVVPEPAAGLTIAAAAVAVARRRRPRVSER